MSVEFDEKVHEYKLNGFRVPSVTQIIGTIFGSKPWFTDYYAQRGSALHKAIEYYNQDELDEESVDERVTPKLNAYKRFYNDFKTSVAVVKAEQFYISKKYRFGGKLDVILSELDDSLILADYKSSFDFSVFLQLAAYRILIKENTNLKISKSLVIILNDDESYKLKWIQKKDFFKHEQIFLSCLNIYNFIKQNNG